MQHPSEPATLRLIVVPDGSPPYDGDAHGPPAVADPAGLTTVRPTLVATPPGNADPPGTTWSRQLAQAIVETIAGTRPFRQVIPATTERVQTQIRGLIQLLRTDGTPRIQRILASPTTPDIVEATVIAAFGPRTRALAMRFEHLPARLSAPGLPPRPSRWLCTDLETP
jgi:hypothetical protein